MVGVRVGFSVLLVSCYAHVFTQLVVVIVTLPTSEAGSGDAEREQQQHDR